MSDKQKKSRVFVIFLVVLVVTIIAIGFYLTFLIVKDGQKNTTSSFNHEETTYVLISHKE